MAGSIALSLTQRYDKTSHEPLDGGLLYFYAAGTTTPQNAYQDISLTIPWPNPIVLDSGGNVPQLFFADGYIKFRLANAAGTTQIAADFVLVMGPTAGSGAAPSVDATTILQPGAIVPYYGTGVRTGFVRANGRSIGSASSSATEYAAADAEELFIVLYADPNLAVSGGRGASAAADWAANKNIALPDWRGRAIAGLDDMGSSAAGRLTASYLGTAATALGAAGGAQSTTLITANLPPYTPQGSIFGAVMLSNGSVVYNIPAGVLQPQITSVSGLDFTGTPQGGTSTAFSRVPPVMLTTIYLKL